MRWNVSLTTSPVRDDTRPWTDVVGAIATAVGLTAILEAAEFSRAPDGGLRIDAALEAPHALIAYLQASSAARLACLGGGIEVPVWSTVLVVSRPAVARRPSAAAP